MKKIIFYTYILLVIQLNSCAKDDNENEKDVIVTIYEETGFGASVMSTVLTEPLMFSDTDNNEVRILMDIITEGLNLYNDYERGYRYKYRARKIWMDPPPMDVSNIKYDILDLVSKEKIITQERVVDLTLDVSSSTIKFSPRFPYVYEDDGSLKVYDALYVNIEGTNEWRGIIEIEGFEFEEGYEYKLKVQETIKVDPYSRSYSLVEVISKEKE